MASIAPIRPSPIAGTWYEGNPEKLARLVDRYLDQAELPEIDGEVIAVIAPHAGHVYSGSVAGYAFAAVAGQSYDLVAVVSPMHQPYYESLLTTAHEAYATPLGEIKVDRDSIKDLDSKIKTASGHGLVAVANDREHSLEIELPFLQRALTGNFKLLPLMVRSQSKDLSRQVGIALAEILQGRKTLLVASTDLSHFYPQEQALKYDQELLHRMETFNPEAVFDAEEEEKGFACGLGALTAVMWAARQLGADAIRILRHATSGDVTGDFSSVVGYGAAVALRSFNE